MADIEANPGRWSIESLRGEAVRRTSPCAGPSRMGSRVVRVTDLVELQFSVCAGPCDVASGPLGVPFVALRHRDFGIDATSVVVQRE